MATQFNPNSKVPAPDMSNSIEPGIDIDFLGGIGIGIDIDYCSIQTIDIGIDIDFSSF